MKNIIILHTHKKKPIKKTEHITKIARILLY